MAITYEELEGFPKEELTQTTFRGTRRLMVDWNSRQALRNALIGYPGALWPYSLSYGARVVSVATEPARGRTQQDNLGADLAFYDKAILTVNYAAPGQIWEHPSNPNAAAAFSEDLEPYTETYPLDFEKYQWSDGTPLTRDEAPVLQAIAIRYRLRLFYLPAIPSALISLIGTINDATVTPIAIAGVTFAAKTLRFDPARFAFNRQSDGTLRYTVEYNFTYRPSGWDKFYRNDTNSWQVIERITDETTHEFYPEADFSTAFPS